MWLYDGHWDYFFRVTRVIKKNKLSNQIWNTNETIKYLWATYHITNNKKIITVLERKKKDISDSVAVDAINSFPLHILLKLSSLLETIAAETSYNSTEGDLAVEIKDKIKDKR